MTVKVFTIDQANRVLPVVEEAVKFVREKAFEIVGIQDKLAVLELIGAQEAESPEHAEMEKLGQEVQEFVLAYNARLQELNNLGCVMKDLNHGLVDFYGRKGDRLVFLCWKLGERKVSFWHELDAGFAGRRPISELDDDEEDEEEDPDD